MKIHRFYIYEPAEINELASKTVDSLFHYQGVHFHQWRHVLRFHEGSEIILFNETLGEVKCVFETLHKDGADLKVLEIKANSSKQFCEITVFVPLIKRDRFEMMLEKLTEVGVSNIVPIVSLFSQINEINTERAEKILREATEQSARIKPPALHPVCTINNEREVGVVTSGLDYAFILHPYQVMQNRVALLSTPLITAIKKIVDEKNKQKNQLNVGLFVGPEGGFSEQEVLNLMSFSKSLSDNHAIQIVNVGDTILRAETAAITSSFLVLQEVATQVRL